MRQFNTLVNTLALIRYNLKIIFAGKFLLFVFAALVFFLLFGTISALDNSNVEVSTVYGLLILPGALIVFYPSVFGIQRDADFHTLEIIFGIPDYRFKVWFVRIILVFIISFILLLPFAYLAHTILISIPVFAMVLHLQVLVIFLGSLGFSLSTMIRNGNGAAVVMIVISLIFFIIQDGIRNSMWNIFLNPFRTPQDVNEVIWATTIFRNRMFLLITSAVLILAGLLNLQNREKILGTG